MEKRPTSITVIGVLLLVFTLLGVVGLVMTATTAAMAEQVAKMHISLPMYQAYGALGIIINLVCVYGIFKGLPWSRVFVRAAAASSISDAKRLTRPASST